MPGASSVISSRAPHLRHIPRPMTTQFLDRAMRDRVGDHAGGEGEQRHPAARQGASTRTSQPSVAMTSGATAMRFVSKALRHVRHLRREGEAERVRRSIYGAFKPIRARAFTRIAFSRHPL